jgi:hypothetical protein
VCGHDCDFSGRRRATGIRSADTHAAACGQLIIGHLAATGADYIFGVDGANIENLYEAAFFQSDITAVLAKHEFSAATMADGHSRSGAGFGVVAVTSGTGALNFVAALGESFTSGVPVLALVGQPATAIDGCGSFQDTSGRNGSLNAEAPQVARENARAELRTVLRARMAGVPHAKDAAGTPGFGSSSALGVTGVMGHPSVVEAVTGSALTGRWQPTGVRVPDVLSSTELNSPAFDGPGVSYRDAMSVLDRVLPVSLTKENRADVVVSA